jgi:hypothetical protein
VIIGREAVPRRAPTTAGKVTPFAPRLGIWKLPFGPVYALAA